MNYSCRTHFFLITLIFKLEEALKLVDEERIIQLASEVIRIPSISGNEKEVMEYTKKLLEGIGVHVEVLP